MKSKITNCAPVTWQSPTDKSIFREVCVIKDKNINLSGFYLTKLDERLQLLLGKGGGLLSVWVVTLKLQTLGGATAFLKRG